MATINGIELKKNNIIAQKEAKTVKGMLETPAFKKKFEEILGAMVIKPQGKPVLVSRDDKRPEMNTINDDFKEEN